MEESEKTRRSEWSEARGGKEREEFRLSDRLKTFVIIKQISGNVGKFV